MFAFFTDFDWRPCIQCGAVLSRAERDSHVCDEQRRIEFELTRLRGETALFDVQLAAYLSSPAGQFEQYYAARQRRRPL